jgi:cell division protein ZapA
MKQLEVQIMGQSYLLGCPDGGDSRLLEAVERVDTAMCKIRDGGKVRARDRIAVLAALNLAFDLADHGAAKPQAPDPAAAPSGVESDTDQGIHSEVHDPRLASLLERLDVALGDDGRLI